MCIFIFVHVELTKFISPLIVYEFGSYRRHCRVHIALWNYHCLHSCLLCLIFHFKLILTSLITRR